MKKSRAFFTALVAMLLCSTMFVACSKDDKDPEPGTNQFVYDGNVQNINGGIQYYYGNYYGNNVNNIELYLAGDNYIMGFEMFVPSTSNKLVAGTYTLADTGQPLTYVSGAVFNDEGEVELEVSSGTVSIAVSGSTYTINFDCTLSNGKKVKGNYTGTLNWEDDSDEGGSSTTSPGAMTVQMNGSSQTYYHTEGYQIGSVGKFMVNFGGTGANGFDFAMAFASSNTTATTLPAGTYTITTTTPMPNGTFTASVKIPGTSTIRKATSGTATVSKSGSTYSITYSFPLDGSPTATVNGTYTGTLRNS